MLLESLNKMIWGFPVLFIILELGIILSIRTRFVQIRLLPNALKALIHSFQNRKRDSSGYRALCTALAATVGIGNIVGVTGAIAIGGPGVVFWMWICGILGMVIKLAEVVLAVKYREKSADGSWKGGPMYIIKNGLPEKYHILAFIYAICGVIASFGIGNATQVNAVVSGVQLMASFNGYHITPLHCIIIGIIIGSLLLKAFRGGTSGIGIWAQNLVPPASILYILLSILFLAMRVQTIPAALSSIFIGAFSPKTATCGLISSALISLRVGASRGVFTNEAGMGTASIAHACSEVEDPVSQGLLGCVEVFLDTIVLCTLTALVILCSGISIPYGTDPGIDLTIRAFTSVLGAWSGYLVVILMCIFAFATVLGWGFYGLKCLEFLFQNKGYRLYLGLHFLAAIIAAAISTAKIWQFSELVNGLMAIPNLIVIYLLSDVFLFHISKYEKSAYSQ